MTTGRINQVTTLSAAGTGAAESDRPPRAPRPTPLREGRIASWKGRRTRLHYRRGVPGAEGAARSRRLRGRPGPCGPPDHPFASSEFPRRPSAAEPVGASGLSRTAAWASKEEDAGGRVTPGGGYRPGLTPEYLCG
jgi:hypothetical protein